MTKKQTKKNLSSVSSHYDVFYCSSDTVLQNESATTACDRFRRLLSDHGGSSGGRQRSQLCPMRLGALRPSALVYLHNDASMTDCWCSLNRLGGDEPDAHLHSAGIETWREKEWKCFMHNVPLKNYSWHYGIFSFVRDTSNLLNPKRPVFKSVACFYDPKGNEKLFKAYCFVYVYLSCVSLSVSSLRVNSSLSSSREKCLSTSCSSSTTQLLRAFLWACLCRIFSSIVPVYTHTHTAKGPHQDRQTQIQTNAQTAQSIMVKDKQY